MIPTDAELLPGAKPWKVVAFRVVADGGTLSRRLEMKSREKAGDARARLDRHPGPFRFEVVPRRFGCRIVATLDDPVDPRARAVTDLTSVLKGTTLHAVRSTDDGIPHFTFTDPSTRAIIRLAARTKKLPPSYAVLRFVPGRPIVVTPRNPMPLRDGDFPYFPPRRHSVSVAI